MELENKLFLIEAVLDKVEHLGGFDRLVFAHTVENAGDVVLVTIHVLHDEVH